MRASVRASAILATSAILFGACASTPPKAPPKEPPAHVLSVSIDRVSLRSTAWMELHTWLAGIARGHDAAPADLQEAAARYATALRDDEADSALWRSTRALATCNADACAAKVLDPMDVGVPFAAAYPDFVKRFWSQRSPIAQAGVEVARAAMTRVAIDPLVMEIENELLLSWPDVAIVDVVAEAPPPARRGLMPVALGAKGSCFVRGDHEDHDRVYDARVIDCVLAQAALGLSDRSRLFAAIARELPVAEAERAWELVVVHGVSAVVSAWEPHHTSVYRRSVTAIEPALVQWLGENWKWRASGESVEAFAARYAAAVKGDRKLSSAPPPPEKRQCYRDTDCDSQHRHPCCLQEDDTGRCFGLPPRADACPDKHLCVDDKDCAPDAKCKPYHGGRKTCQGGAKLAPALPGKCLGRPPNAPPDPDCGDKP